MVLYSEVKTDNVYFPTSVVLYLIQKETLVGEMCPLVFSYETSLKFLFSYLL